ncbi:TetR/AcrR family transcriptional regulator [Aneurinibacillus danicus]|jgi:AcrR family transcriptional regulator|uniref:HTH tetR-type domain-containing protein n=2 Tax=Aneurinibacillus TaxID=55079 RepID=A0A511V1H3_9BACL|nr:TetR/AcrR family transcriptional regulator [Aneurinibacillus danicus]GEN32750.1 hypothetical protein ADA01nite_02100 [Aneurinibacillus danicus]
MSHSFQQRILTAAHKIFIEKGYRQADMRSIAKEAGIAVGTIYNYYPNKAVLYQAILVQQSDELDHRIFQITRDEEQTSIEKLQSITELLLAFAASHSSFWREIVEDPQRNAEMRDEGHKAQMQAHEQLKKHLLSVFAEFTAQSAWTERHVLTYMAAVTHIGFFFPDQQEENRRYVMGLVQHMIDQSAFEDKAEKHIHE